MNTLKNNNNNNNNNNRLWWVKVRPEHRNLARMIVEDCDWSWTTPLLSNGIIESAKNIEEYQLFILCKIVANDIQKHKGADRLFLSPPSGSVDELWHEHMLRPMNYMNMCWALLKDRVKGEVSSPMSFIIDHTPESVDDSDEVKEVRRRNTRDYMNFLCPGGWSTTKIQTRHARDIVVLEEDGDDLLKEIDLIIQGEEEEQQKKKKQRSKQRSSNIISFVVKTLHGKQIPIELPADSLIRDVAEYIEETEGYPVGEQILVFAGISTSFNRSLSDYNIRDGSTVHLVIGLKKLRQNQSNNNNSNNNNDEPIAIIIRTLTGKKFPCSIRLSSSVNALKEFIQDHEGVPPDQQRLIWRGQQLDEGGEGAVLSDYAIQPGDIVELILKLRGC